MSRFGLRGIDGSGQFELPDWAGATASFEFSDVGGIVIDYPKVGINAGRVVDNIQVFLTLDGVEVDNSRCLVQGLAGNDAEEGATNLSVSARSLLAVFDGAKTLGPTPTAPTPVAFVAKSPGEIIRSLLTQAQARGTATGITFASFSNTTDSSGTTWPTTLTQTWDVGVSLLDVIKDMVARRFIDVRFVGADFRVYIVDTIASDLSALSTPVHLRAGLDFTEAPYQRTTDTYASDVIAQGDNGSVVRVQRSSANPFGRVETMVSQSGTADTGLLTIVANAELDARNRTRVDKTHGLIFTAETQWFPVISYKVGDWIFRSVGDGNVPERLRIRSMSVVLDSGGIVTASITLNDKFVEADIRAAAKISALMGGSNTTNPNGPGSYIDVTVPNAPTIAGIASGNYTQYDGTPAAVVTATLTTPSTNTDGTPCTDVQWYVVRWRYQDALVPPNPGAWNYVTGETDPVVTFSGVRNGVTIAVQGGVIDSSNHVSAWSASTTHSVAIDTTPPNQPSTPGVSTRKGVLIITWDGKDSAAAAYGINLGRVDVHVSTTTGFTPSAATLRGSFPNGADTLVLDDLPYGTTQFVRFVAYSKNGYASTVSVQASATPNFIVTADVAFKDDGNLLQDGSFESQAVRASLVLPASVTYDSTVAWKIHGDYSLLWGTLTGTRTMTLEKNIIAKAGSKFWCRCMCFRSTGYTATSIKIIARCTLQNGTFSDAVLLDIGARSAIGTVPSWGELQTPVDGAGNWTPTVLPANTVKFDIVIESVGNTAGQCFIDQIEIRQITSTALIEDAAITNAKIVSLTGAKIDAGSITTEKLRVGSTNNNMMGPIHNPSFDGGGTGLTDGGPGDRGDAFGNRDVSIVPDIGWTFDGGSGFAQLKCGQAGGATNGVGRSLYIRNQAGNAASSATCTAFMPCVAGVSYTFGCHALQFNGTNGKTYFRLAFYNASFTVTGYADCAGLFGASGPVFLECAAVSATAPATSVMMRVQCFVLGAANGGSAGMSDFLFTGMFVQETGIGTIDIQPGGIKMFNASGTKTIDLNGISGLIRGVTILGSVLQSDSGGGLVTTIQNGSIVVDAIAAGAMRTIIDAAGWYFQDSGGYSRGAGFPTSNQMWITSPALAATPFSSKIIMTPGTSAGAATIQLFGSVDTPYDMTVTGNTYLTGAYGLTTALAANMYFASPGRVFRSTSSRKYKKNITDLLLDTDTVLKIRPVRFQSKEEIEGVDSSLWHIGFIAEEIHDLGLKEFVHYDSDGNPEGLQYERFTAALLLVAREQEARIQVLENLLDVMDPEEDDEDAS